MRCKFCYRSLQPTAAYHRYRKIYFFSVAGYSSVLDTATFFRIFEFSLITILNFYALPHG